MKTPTEVEVDGALPRSAVCAPDVVADQRPDPLQAGGSACALGHALPKTHHRKHRFDHVQRPQVMPVLRREAEERQQRPPLLRQTRRCLRMLRLDSATKASMPRSASALVSAYMMPVNDHPNVAIMTRLVIVVISCGWPTESALIRTISSSVAVSAVRRASSSSATCVPDLFIPNPRPKPLGRCALHRASRARRGARPRRARQGGASKGPALRPTRLSRPAAVGRGNPSSTPSRPRPASGSAGTGSTAESWSRSR